IPDDGVGGWAVDALTGADEEACREELPEVLRDAAERSPDIPYGDADREDPSAAEAVDVIRDRQADQRVEQPEGRSEQQPEQGVGDREVRLDARGEVRNDADVELVGGEAQDEHEQRVVRRARSRPGGWFARLAARFGGE